MPIHPPDLRAPAAAAADAREPASPRRLPDTLRVGWQRLRAGHDRLNDSALGDALAVLCLAVTGYVIFVIAGCLQ